MNARNAMAANATLHCLTGCSIGEILGMLIGTWFGLSNLATIPLAIALAFVFGYGLSTLPLIQAGLGFVAALSVVFAADTVSIVVMEVVDNLVMALIPGAMSAGLNNTLFWVSMTASLVLAFMAAFPVNRYLIDKGKGHALTHAAHDPAGHHGASSRRFSAPSPATLAAAIIGFLLGGFIASLGASTVPDHPESAGWETVAPTLAQC